jgi:hypothetical protein
LYILDNNSFPDRSFAHIFSQSVACLSILLKVSLTEWKLLTLMKPSLFFISWIVPMMSYLECHCQNKGHLDFFLYHLLGNLVLHFTFLSYPFWKV